MSRGITPRFTTWCPEPTTPLGRDNPDGAPLEYHVRLLEAYRATLERHGLEAAARLRRRGAGNAVFSVSSFMDTLAPEEVRSRRRSRREPHLGRRGARACGCERATTS